VNKVTKKTIRLNKIFIFFCGLIHNQLKKTDKNHFLKVALIGFSGWFEQRNFPKNYFNLSFSHYLPFGILTICYLCCD